MTQTLPPPTVVAPKTSLSTAALVLGIVALCIGLIPILGIFALPCGILAVIFGFVGIKRKARKGFAVAGLVTGLLGILLAIVGLVIVSNAVDHLNDCGKAISADARNGTNTSSAICNGGS